MRYYHFQSLKNLKRDLDYLKNDKIWFSPYKYLNDPNEGKVSLRLYNKGFMTWLYLIGYGRKFYQKWMNSVITSVEKSYEMTKERIGIYSLTKTLDSELMWSYYADGHQGICSRTMKLSFLEFP